MRLRIEPPNDNDLTVLCYLAVDDGNTSEFIVTEKNGNILGFTSNFLKIITSSL